MRGKRRMFLSKAVTTHRVWTVCFLMPLAGISTARAAEDPLGKARKLLLGGKYAEAVEIYAPRAAEDPAAALGLARCLRAEGKLQEAVETLSAAAEGHADLQAELARLAFQRGDFNEAEARAGEALRLDADQLLARWIRAELDRAVGRLEEAERGYRWLIDFHNRHSVQRAESLRWIGLAAARYARWNRLSDQFHFLVAVLYPKARKLEPDYWPAHYEAGMLLLEKHNLADAARQFQAGLQCNPNAAEVHVALARLALANRDPTRAEQLVRRALEINPGLLSAWHCKADLAWANFQTQSALELLRQEALPLCPVSEETLGRMAACYLLLDGSPRPGQQTRFTRLVEEVTERNPHAGDFYWALAAALEARSKLPEAQRFCREAIKVMRRMVGPRSRLGLLQIRMGREAEAEATLREAFEVDPFNLRVNNTLELLDVLGEMQTLTTEHVRLKFDGQRDWLLARSAARLLDTIYPQWCRRFNYRPRDKPLVEIFSRARGTTGREWFSTRMIGLPYLGTVAASTGYLVAMSSPNEPDSDLRFNWARVLKHELVHVITLQQTDFNIPHWYTEGLAVWSEGRPRPARWRPLLRTRVSQGKLFNLRTINAGFTRPHDSDDWQLAYCQAALYVDYMLCRWGSGRQRRFLLAFAEAMDTPAAIRRAFDVSEGEFERGYREYLDEQTAEMTALKWPSETSLADLLEQHRRGPDDAETAAELALAYLQRGADREALRLTERVLQRSPGHQLATYVLARLRVKAGRTREAMQMLEACLDLESPQPNALNLLAALKLKAERYEEAAHLYALGEGLDSVNIQWTKSLARVYMLSDSRPALRDVLIRLAGADADDVTVRKKLAQMALRRRDYAAAEKWANQVIEIDVMDAEARAILGRSLVTRRAYGRAVEELEIAVELGCSDPFTWFALADAYLRANRPDKARDALNTLLTLTPDYPGAALLLKSLEESEVP